MVKCSRQKLYDAILYVDRKYRRKRYECLEFYVSYSRMQGLRLFCYDVSMSPVSVSEGAYNLTYCFEERLSRYDLTEVIAIEISRWIKKEGIH